MATEILRPQAVSGPRLPPYIPTNENTQVPEPKIAWLRPTSRDAPIAEMKARLKQDGYVFVKGVIPRDDVAAMRERYFSAYKGTGLTDAAHPVSAGIFNSSHGQILGIGGGDITKNDPKEVIVLTQAHTDPFYRSFVAHPALRSMVRALTGWREELLLDRTMLRHNVPGASSTGVHYDKLFLRDGDSFFLTAWVPIGDISADGGGLIYLQDSTSLGKAIEEDFTSRARDMTQGERISAFNANMTTFGILNATPEQFERDHDPDHQMRDSIPALRQAEKKDYRWLVANYEAGDVVFHDPYAIHSSSRNEDTQGRIRLSTDLRFYDLAELETGGVDKRWMKVWTPDDGL